MNKDFESIKGCEVIRHEEACIVKGERTCDLLLQAGAVSFVAGGVIALAEEIAGRNGGVGGTFLVVGAAFFLLGFLWALSGPVSYPERWTLHITEEMSALDLLKMQEQYNIRKTGETGVWFATPK